MAQETKTTGERLYKARLRMPHIVNGKPRDFIRGKVSFRANQDWTIFSCDPEATGKISQEPMRTEWVPVAGSDMLKKRSELMSFCVSPSAYKSIADEPMIEGPIELSEREAAEIKRLGVKVESADGVNIVGKYMSIGDLARQATTPHGIG